MKKKEPGLIELSKTWAQSGEPLTEKKLKEYLIGIFNKRAIRYPMILGVQEKKAEEWSKGLGYPSLKEYCDSTNQIYPNNLGWYQIRTDDAYYTDRDTVLQLQKEEI